MNESPGEQIKTLIAIALTFISGAMDVASFTRLGDVFTSVMTGNIVLLGLAVARGSLTLASHTVVSIAGYVAGVAAGTWVAYGAKVTARAAKAKTGGDEGRASGLPGLRPLGAARRAHPAGRVHRRLGGHRDPPGRVGPVLRARDGGGRDGRAGVHGQVHGPVGGVDHLPHRDADRAGQLAGQPRRGHAARAAAVRRADRTRGGRRPERAARRGRGGRRSALPLAGLVTALVLAAAPKRWLRSSGREA